MLWPSRCTPLRHPLLAPFPELHTHTFMPPTPPSLLHTPSSRFVLKCLEHSYCLPPPPPHLTVFYLSLFFLLRCFSPFLLSVSIGGHGLGKPNEWLFVLLYCFLFIFCEHGGWWHRRSSGSPIMSLLFVLMTLFYPILFYFTYHNGFLLTFY